MPLVQLEFKFARCASCGDFYTVNHMTRVECPGCTYRTYRCKSCGGADGAHRSLLAHYSYWRTRVGGEGGHRRKFRA